MRIRKYRPRRVWPSDTNDNMAIRDSLGALNARERRLQPEAFARVDAIKARPGWRPWWEIGGH